MVREMDGLHVSYGGTSLSIPFSLLEIWWLKLQVKSCSEMGIPVLRPPEQWLNQIEFASYSPVYAERLWYMYALHYTSSKSSMEAFWLFISCISFCIMSIWSFSSLMVFCSSSFSCSSRSIYEKNNQGYDIKQFRNYPLWTLCTSKLFHPSLL